MIVYVIVASWYGNAHDDVKQYPRETYREDCQCCVSYAYESRVKIKVFCKTTANTSYFLVCF